MPLPRPDARRPLRLHGFPIWVGAWLVHARWRAPGAPLRQSGQTGTPCRRLRAALTLLTLSLLPLTPARAELLLERAFLPHGASPSSFAVGLPGGIHFCFDPVRAAVSYVWTGGFVDLSATRPGPGKFLSPAKLLGPLVYQESGDAPLRRGDPARAPVVEFTGYSLRGDAIEFRYTIDGTPVREEIRARPDGTALQRRLHIATGADARWWHVVAGRPAQELRRERDGSFLLELPLARPAAP